LSRLLSGSELASALADGDVLMKILAGRTRYGNQTFGLVTACIFLLGLAANNAARVPNPNRDAETSLQPGIEPSPTAAAASKSGLIKDEKFTGQTNVREYRFTINTDRGEVHLNVTAEIKQGLLRCELIDPTGAVRTKIGTTEHASMNTNDMKAIKGEWLLRLTLEDATGKYQVHWVE
jgi:hypothetical protein